MLRDFDDSCKLSDAECPRCDAAGNFRRHASYERNLVTEEGAGRVTIERVMCLSCRTTHALIPPDVVPYRQHSLGLHLAVARSWSEGASLSQMAARFGLAPTTLLRILRTVRVFLAVLLACGRERGRIRAALGGLSDADVAARSLATRRACAFENVRFRRGRSRAGASASGFT